jgi:2-aminoethylphosphonate aminotransferase
MKIRRNILLNPGPATTTDSVKRALVVPDICPREREFGRVMDEVRGGLLDVVNAGERYDCVLFAGSGTCAMEVCVSSVVAPGRKIAVVVNGAYGERMVQMAKAHGIPCVEIRLPSNRLPDPRVVREVLRKDRGIGCLAMVHHETTTGMLNPLRAMGRVARQAGCSYAVDAVSSFAGVPIDIRKDGVDFLVSTSNKCIQGMAGIAFVVCRKAALEKIKAYPRRSVYLSLYDQYDYFRRHGQMRFTPPVQVVYALRQAVREYRREGGRNRYRRYTTNWKLMKTGLARLGFRFLLPAEHESHILTTVLEPENPKFSFEAMHDQLLRQGFTIYPGKLGGQKTFRLANMGDLHPRDIARFLAALEKVLRKMR